MNIYKTASRSLQSKRIGASLCVCFGARRCSERYALCMELHINWSFVNPPALGFDTVSPRSCFFHSGPKTLMTIFLTHFFVSHHIASIGQRNVCGREKSHKTAQPTQSNPFSYDALGLDFSRHRSKRAKIVPVR